MAVIEPNKPKPCKRLLVRIAGMDRTGFLAYTENYNETAEGCTNEPGKCGCTHAEINLLKVMEYPYRVIISHSPCLDCAKALVAAGIEQVYYIACYRMDNGLNYLKEKNVYTEQITIQDDEGRYWHDIIKYIQTQ